MLNAVIDISHFNGTQLNFPAAAADGILGVIQKATQGTTYVDPTFSSNRQAILAAGLLFGSYHFGDGTDGAAQANHYLSVVGPLPDQLLALDLEDNSSGPSMTLQQASAFVTTVFNKIGKWPVLYSGQTLKSMMTNQPDTVLVNCPLWLAQYGPSAVLPNGWSAWSLWQYTDGTQPGSQPVNGIGACDRDRFNGTADQLPGFWASASAG